MDFTITTTQGTERIARLAFDYARRNGKRRVSIITKANVIKTTDGKFLNLCKEIAKEYPEITVDDWYIDIATAKLVDEKRRTAFEVFVLPTCTATYSPTRRGIQGGGHGGSANIGKRYAMFEPSTARAAHGGGGPRPVRRPCSMLRASVMLLSHIGRQEKAALLERALDRCMFEERRLIVTGRDTGATCSAFGEYVMETLGALM